MLAHSPVLDAVLDDLAGRYEHVLLDLPAVHATGDALHLARKCEGVVMVVGAGVTTETQVSRAVADLGGVSVIGAVVNRQSSSVPSFIRRRFAV
jgi:Mrp family chromosome partitioning ATPase